MVQGLGLGTPSITIARLLRDFTVAISLFFGVGCAQTTIQPLTRVGGANLPLPSRVLVKHFTIDHSVVSEYQGIMRQQPANPDPVARQSEIARNVSETLTANLIHGIRQRGFTVEVIKQSTLVDHNDLIIEGQFLSVDEGSPLRRLVIGFGSGASKLETHVQVYRGSARQKLMEFATLADSGKLPGVVATLPVGTLAPTGVGVSIAAGSAVSTRMNITPSQVTSMAASSAEQAVRFLFEFFSQQGWIEANRAKKAQIVH